MTCKGWMCQQHLCNFCFILSGWLVLRISLKSRKLNVTWHEDNGMKGINKLHRVHMLLCGVRISWTPHESWRISFAGLHAFISANPKFYHQLLSGGNHDIDIDDLRKNTRYTGGYTEGSRTVKLFWEVYMNYSSPLFSFYVKKLQMWYASLSTWTVSNN